MNIRTTKPTASDLYYVTKSRGGWSNCIQGSPTDAGANVLANCVGYACGRFNEIVGSMKYPDLNCNAENFIERAQGLYGLQVSQIPSIGAIMCWRKGNTFPQDGAGHVAIVERVDSNSQVYTSESAYGGTTFYNKTRSNANGNWGLDSPYYFRGFIVNPASPSPTPAPDPTQVIGTPTTRDITKNQIEVTTTILRGRSGPYLMDNVKGLLRPGLYNMLQYLDMREEASNGYEWYNIGEYLWCAQVGGVKYYPGTVPTPTDEIAKLKSEIAQLNDKLKAKNDGLTSLSKLTQSTLAI